MNILLHLKGNKNNPFIPARWICFSVCAKHICCDTDGNKMLNSDVSAV